MSIPSNDPDAGLVEVALAGEGGNGGVPNGDNGDDYITVGGTIIQVDKFGLMMPWIIVIVLVLLAITSMALWMKNNKTS